MSQLKELERFACSKHDQMVAGVAKMVRYMKLQHRVEPEDIAQSAYLVATQRIDQFRGECSLHTWLHTIAKSLLLYEKKLRTSHKGYLIYKQLETLKRQIRPKQHQEEIEHYREEIQSAIEQIQEPGLQELVFLQLAGMEYKDIARLLGTPIGTIRSRLHRARSHLKALLKDKMDQGVFDTPGNRLDPIHYFSVEVT